MFVKIHDLFTNTNNNSLSYQCDYTTVLGHFGDFFKFYTIVQKFTNIIEKRCRNIALPILFFLLFNHRVEAAERSLRMRQRLTLSQFTNQICHQIFFDNKINVTHRMVIGNLCIISVVGRNRCRYRIRFHKPIVFVEQPSYCGNIPNHLCPIGISVAGGKSTFFFTMREPTVFRAKFAIRATITSFRSILSRLII